MFEAEAHGFASRVKFIVDAQLPPSLAETLRQAGCDAVAVREIDLRDAKDEDFAERCLASGQAPVVIWLRIGNATTPELVGWFMPQWPSMLARLQAGDRFIEVR